MDQELVQYLNERFDGIDRRFEQIDQRFGQIDRRFEGVAGQIKGFRQEMHDGFDEVKRHSGVLVEDLRYQVRLVAEGFATFVEGRYTQDQARIDERFRETHALIRLSFDNLRQQDDQIRQRVENLERKDQG
jgi:archaellum component FlaC